MELKGKDNVENESERSATEADPLSNERNKHFSLQFFTNFAIKGYSGTNQYDIT